LEGKNGKKQGQRTREDPVRLDSRSIQLQELTGQGFFMYRGEAAGKMIDVAVIGAGVVGTLIARELSRFDLEIALLDKSNDVANGSTKANSGIIHAGYDAEPGTRKARFNVLGNPLFDELCEQLDVRLHRVGSLVVAFSPAERETVDQLYLRGARNGVPGLRIIEREELKSLEPNLDGAAQCALHAPQAGIIDPWEIAVAAAENAADNGVEVLLNFTVEAIQCNQSGANGGFRIIGRNGEIKARRVINCAGAFADRVHDMIAPPAFTIIPRKGQYFVLDKTAGELVNHVIFQCPTQAGKGVLVTRSVHGNLLVGPDAWQTDEREDLSTNRERLDFVRRSAGRISKKIPFTEVIRSFSGLRATPSTGDFVIGEAEQVPGFIDVAGIESPGLTAAPAIARYVRELLGRISGNPGALVVRKDFNPLRRRVPRFMELSRESKNRLIRKDPRFGRIICRCESITEGEIVDAIHRNVGARTLDGVKKRVRPGMGRCQGGFCGPQVLTILARELGKDPAQIVKNELDSYLLTGATKDCGSDVGPLRSGAAAGGKAGFRGQL
jgi:glycerol-3-phosphate dehydrogenase